MSGEKQDTEQAIELSDADLEAVKRLLKEEERLGETERSALRVLLAFVVVIAILVFACPTGLLIVWFERVLGIGLLIASAVAVVVACAIVWTKRDSFKVLTTTVDQTVKDSQVAQAIATHIEPSQAKTVSNLVGYGCLFMPLLFLLGVGWFFYSLLATGTVNLLSLILIAVPIAALFLLSYYQVRREFVHYSRVSRLRSLLKSPVEGAEKKAISSEQVAFLRQLEAKQIMHKVRQAATETPLQAEKSYSIGVDVKAREYLERLPLEQNLALRSTIDSLQLDPHPSSAESVVVEDADLLKLEEGNSAIVYRIDKKTRIVVVVDIHDTGSGEEVEDAS